jgi:hypothetical protein
MKSVFLVLDEFIAVTCDVRGPVCKSVDDCLNRYEIVWNEFINNNQGSPLTYEMIG